MGVNVSSMSSNSFNSTSECSGLKFVFKSHTGFSNVNKFQIYDSISTSNRMVWRAIS